LLAGIDAFDKWLPTLSRADKPPVDALACIARGAMPNVAVPKGSRPRKEPSGPASRPLEGHRDVDEVNVCSRGKKGGHNIIWIAERI